MLAGVCNQVPNLEMDAAGKVIEKGIPALAATVDAEADEDSVDPKTDTQPEVKDQALEVAQKIIPGQGETPDTEPFDFGPPIDQEKLKEANEQYEADQDKLKEHMEALRASRIEYGKKLSKIRGGGWNRMLEREAINLDKEFYHTAYTKFINYYNLL